VPDHTSWLTLLLSGFADTLDHNAAVIGESFVGKKPATWQSFEPIAMSVLIAIVVIVMSLSVRAKLSKVEEAVVPDDKLTLRTFMEVFLGYFYNLAKGIMGPERAKKYFPLIGASSVFVFCANVMALIPGAPVATSTLSITIGSALVVFILFNLYGLASNGFAYIKHLAGPVWYLAPLVFIIEVISLFVRPITLALRLMLNMAVDHLLLSIFLGFLPLLLPLPVMLLGCLVVLIQTLVFTMLTAIYIGLATDPHMQEHEGGHEHAHAPAHGH
jgi:F-type H+-transporting ATPase subunit a